jgi:hypothetical protein
MTSTKFLYHLIRSTNPCITAIIGAIVAIRDLDQQMYISVKNTGIQYQVVGAYHYSLAGEHALFRVILSTYIL